LELDIFGRQEARFFEEFLGLVKTAAGLVQEADMEIVWA
jgi:hypothetical protein